MSLSATSGRVVYEMTTLRSVSTKHQWLRCRQTHEFQDWLLFSYRLRRFGAHIGAGFGPFVVLLGEHGAAGADDGVAAGKMSMASVRRRLSRSR